MAPQIPFDGVNHSDRVLWAPAADSPSRSARLAPPSTTLAAPGPGTARLPSMRLDDSRLTGHVFDYYDPPIRPHEFRAL
jgi:hypothetical protein